MPILTELERRVLGLFLEGDTVTLHVLRAQLETAELSRLEWTGVGFFTHFSVSSTTERLTYRKRFVLSEVLGSTAEDSAAAGFLLFVEDGELRMLEGYTYGNDPWPEREDTLAVAYSNQRIADLATLGRVAEGGAGP
jgi:hypothetical protein